MLGFLLGLVGFKIGWGSAYCLLALHAWLGPELVKEQGGGLGQRGDQKPGLPALRTGTHTHPHSLPFLFLFPPSLPLSPFLSPFIVSGLTSLGLFLYPLSLCLLSLLPWLPSSFPSPEVYSSPRGASLHGQRGHPHTVFYTVFLRYLFMFR